MTLLRGTWLLALVAMTLFAPGIRSSAAAPARQSTTATMQNLAFVPKTITVSAGSTVVWTNQDQVQHSVTADGGTFDSGLLDPGQTFSVTFDTPGTYAYYCVPHGFPGGAGMSGVVVVQ